jgi:putative transposase
MRRLKQLDEENRRLMKLVADLSLNKEMLQNVIRWKNMRLVRQREMIDHVRTAWQVSIRRACRALPVERSTITIARIHQQGARPVGLHARRHSRLQPTGQADRQRLHRSFNGEFRSECLNANWFPTLDEAQRKCEASPDEAEFS